MRRKGEDDLLSAMSDLLPVLSADALCWFPLLVLSGSRLVFAGSPLNKDIIFDVDVVER